jgi:putative peptide zinc metalloprotease protein
VQEESPEAAQTRVMPVADDLPPAQDGNVSAEGHARAEADAAAQAPPKLAAGIELIGEYEDSGFKEAPYIARRADGQVIQMAELLYLVAEQANGQRSYAEIAEIVTQKFERGLDAEMVQMLVEEKLRPLGVLETAAGEPDADLQKLDPMLALKFRAAVVPEGLVNALTKIFKPLFFPPVVAAVLIGLVGADVWLFGYHGVAQSMRQALYDPLFILIMLGLVILSAAFHETGHATAAAYGGARPGVMGAGVYIVWPAFYTDVTDAYRLGKGGRLRTDLGGVYFNVIFMLATVGAYFATGFEPLLLLIPLQHMEIIHQFLPFLRLDGYYIVADLTGVPDMFARIKPTLKSLIPWKKADDAVTELKPWVRVAVTIYVLLLIPILLFFLGITLINMPRIFATAYDSFMLTAHKLGHASGLAIAVDVIQLIVLLLVPIGLIVTLYQLARRAATGAWNVTEGRPVARAALVMATSAAAAFAAYVWIPTSVYRPIQPGERGTLVGAVDQFQAVPTGTPALTPQRARQLGGAPLESKAGGGTKTPIQPATTQTTQTATTSTTSTSTVPASTTPVSTITASTTTTPASTAPALTTTTDTTTTTTTTTTTMTTTTP